VDVPLSLVNNLSKEDEASVRWGSKCQLAAWYTYTALICQSSRPTRIIRRLPAKKCIGCMKFMLLFF
jgi:hypothetical protein